MSTDQIGGLTTTPAVGAAAAAAAPAPNKTEVQVRQLAQEFEAMLMTQMLRDLRRSMVSDESSEGYGNDAMSDTTDIEMGRALSRSGGLGLTNVLLRAIVRQAAPAAESGGTKVDAAPVSAQPPVLAAPTPLTPAPPSTPPPVATPAVPSLQPASEEGAPAVEAPKGPVTSPFGWRRDPFTGAARFHSGVDIGLPHGTPVRAAASGQVVFAGANGGYGNMVVIERPSGQQVRYAHLAVQNVRTGDVVEQGQVIGQVGNTGRSTGAHLHVEVIENGRAVDPAALD
jgi:murein DD-endopeptidase MepM/ murein hydrolase activator NlpD